MDAQRYLRVVQFLVQFLYFLPWKIKKANLWIHFDLIQLKINKSLLYSQNGIQFILFE